MKEITTRRTGRLVAVALGALTLLIATFLLLGQSFLGDGAEAEARPNPKNLSSFVEKSDGPAKAAKEDAPKSGDKGSLKAPKDDRLTLTVPGMDRVDGVKVYDAPASDNETLDKGAMHIKGTGYPWQKGANVFIAGHRLGYRDTGSYLLFRDLDKLENGDEIYLTDSKGREYTYRVFEKFIVNPDAGEVMNPVEDKNVVSLQSCTLPDYKERIIVQGELKSIGLNR